MTATSLDTRLIAETAYGIWIAEGQPEGRDEANWFAAIEKLSAPAPKAKRSVKAKVEEVVKAATKPRAKKADKAA